MRLPQINLTASKNSAFNLPNLRRTVPSAMTQSQVKLKSCVTTTNGGPGPLRNPRLLQQPVAAIVSVSQDAPKSAPLRTQASWKVPSISSASGETLWWKSKKWQLSVLKNTLVAFRVPNKAFKQTGGWRTDGAKQVSSLMSSSSVFIQLSFTLTWKSENNPRDKADQSHLLCLGFFLCLVNACSRRCVLGLLKLAWKIKTILWSFSVVWWLDEAVHVD